MYASQWFMTLFAYNFPLPLVAMVWDLFFATGWAVVFRVALTLLANERQRLCGAKSLEEVMLVIRDIPRTVTVEQVFPKAIHLNVPDPHADMQF